MWRIFALLFSILIMGSVTSALILYNLYNTNQSGNKTISAIINKLDILHNQSNAVIDAQGNLSHTDRQKLIHEFEAIESEGGLATKSGQQNNNHILQEVLSNVTEIAKQLNIR